MRMTPLAAFLILAFCAGSSSAFRPVDVGANAESAVGAATAVDYVSAKAFGPSPGGGVKFTTAVPAALSAGIMSSTPTATAIALAKQLYGLADADIRVHSSYSTQHNGLTHVHLRQLVRGVDVENANMNVNVDKDGKVISYGSTFAALKPEDLAKARLWGSRSVAFVRPEAAVRALLTHLQIVTPAAIRLTETEAADGKFRVAGLPMAAGEVVAKRAYMLQDDSSLSATWEIELPMASNWFHAHVKADGTTVTALNDWVQNFAQMDSKPKAQNAGVAYRIVGINDDNPTDSDRVMVKDPAQLSASPDGWHAHGPTGTKFTTTVGNNVYAQENWGGRNEYLNNKRPDGGAGLTFDFPFDKTATDMKKNIDGAVTNLFFWNNFMHDVSETYGFDDAAGNFQMVNVDSKGKGSDPVIANAQDGSGMNNANFATPPDGSNGRMRMYNWNTITPNRDGDFANVIIVHEYAHGISNRLTGGPANSNCLGWGQPGGMGEGWGDFLAVLFQITDKDTRKRSFAMGAWVYKGKSIRNYNYSTDMTTNPTTFNYISKSGWSGVHSIGEVWAEMLYEVTWNIIEATGNKINSDFYSRDLTSGNTLMWQLIIDGMKIQPCSPSFVDARNAILQAEKAATNKAEYACAIWKGFAKRGLGFGATASPVKESFELPAECKSA